MIQSVGYNVTLIVFELEMVYVLFWDMLGKACPHYLASFGLD